MFFAIFTLRPAEGGAHDDFYDRTRDCGMCRECNFRGPRTHQTQQALRQAWAIYRLWRYPPRFYRIVMQDWNSWPALFLIVPETRIWGVFVSGMITFIATVTLLRHRQYLWSLPAMLLLMSLIPVSLEHTR